MEMTPQQIGKELIVAGLVIAAIGVLLVVFGRLGLFRLPGEKRTGHLQFLGLLFFLSLVPSLRYNHPCRSKPGFL